MQTTTNLPTGQQTKNMNGRQIYALRMAANIIKQLDTDLVKLGKGRNLSNLPGFEGQDFASALIAMASNAEKLNAPEPEDTQTLLTPKLKI